MSPRQRRDSGAYWARAKSISGVFESDGVTFCRCTPAAARLRNLYIFTPYLSQEHWWLCMVINVSVQYSGRFLPEIILLTQGYYHWGTRLHTM